MKCFTFVFYFAIFSKGDAAIHNEISVFVYRYDLKQSQIARMAGIYFEISSISFILTYLLSFLAVNQAYVSKFLRGDLFDLSENGRMAICRWYIRYKKIVQSMGKSNNSIIIFCVISLSFFKVEHHHPLNY